jgi:uncharacterized membrane protein YphA (DoxX/SURF4 family)
MGRERASVYYILCLLLREVTKKESMSQNQLQVLVKRNPLACPGCGETFSSREELREHRKQNHGRLSPLGKSSIGASLVSLALRLYMGSVMMMHGFPKLTSKRKEVIEGMQSLGVPPALTIATALLEFIGGIFLLVGFLVPLVSSLFAAEMTGTTILNKTKMQKTFLSGSGKPNFEVDVSYLAVFLALAVLGAGAFSVDEKLKI